MVFSCNYVFLIMIASKLLNISKIAASLTLNVPSNLLSASITPMIFPLLSLNGTARTVLVFI